MFAVLPFGLSTACYIFTKLMRPLVRYWRGRGLKAIVYLDDSIIAAEGESEALTESSRVQHDLQLVMGDIGILLSRLLFHTLSRLLDISRYYIKTKKSCYKS